MSNYTEDDQKELDDIMVADSTDAVASPVQGLFGKLLAFFKQLTMTFKKQDKFLLWKKKYAEIVRELEMLLQKMSVLDIKSKSHEVSIEHLKLKNKAENTKTQSQKSPNKQPTSLLIKSIEEVMKRWVNTTEIEIKKLLDKLKPFTKSEVEILKISSLELNSKTFSKVGKDGKHELDLEKIASKLDKKSGFVAIERSDGEFDILKFQDGKVVIAIILEPPSGSKISAISLEQIGKEGGSVINIAQPQNLEKGFEAKLKEDLSKAGVPVKDVHVLSADRLLAERKALAAEGAIAARDKDAKQVGIGEGSRGDVKEVPKDLTNNPNVKTVPIEALRESRDLSTHPIDNTEVPTQTLGAKTQLNTEPNISEQAGPNANVVALGRVNNLQSNAGEVHGNPDTTNQQVHKGPPTVEQVPDAANQAVPNQVANSAKEVVSSPKQEPVTATIGQAEGAATKIRQEFTRAQSKSGKDVKPAVPAAKPRGRVDKQLTSVTQDPL